MSTHAPQQQRDNRSRATVEGPSVKDAAASSLRPFAARPEAASHSALAETLQQSAAVQAQLRLSQSLGESPRVAAQAQSAAAQGVIQRKLVVGGVDYTKQYKDKAHEVEKQAVINEVVGHLNTVLGSEPELAEEIGKNNAAIGKQLVKWIEDVPGYRGPEEGTKPHSRPHMLYGRKEQNRAYANWKELALGLLGWVEGKPLRRAERKFAESIYADKTLSIFMDSLINKLFNKIMTLKEQGIDSARVDAI